MLQKKRLTREESQAQTREQLLDAAYAMFVSHGVETTSIEQVTEAAGYSRGAFYSNFDSKDDLICAVLERQIERVHQELSEIFARPISIAERRELVRGYYVQVSSHADTCVFWLTMQTYALNHESARERIAALMAKDRANVVSFIHFTYAEMGLELPVAAEVLAHSLMAHANGLALAQRVDPKSISREQIQEALGLYFDQMIAKP